MFSDLTLGVSMKRTIGILFCLAVAGAQVFSAVAQEGKSTAQRILEAFNGLCVQNAKDFSNIDHMMPMLGGRELSKEFQQGDRAMREMGGNSYALAYDGFPLIVAYANEGGCSVIVRDIDRKNLVELVEQKMGAVHIHTAKQAIQTTDFFRIEDDAPNGGALIYLVYGEADTGWTEGTISFLPQRLVGSRFDELR